MVRARALTLVQVGQGLVLSLHGRGGGGAEDILEGVQLGGVLRHVLRFIFQKGRQSLTARRRRRRRAEAMLKRGDLVTPVHGEMGAKASFVFLKHRQ